MKKTKVIRTKPLTAEEDWYRTYHLDIEEILNELDSSEELVEKLLGWSLQKSINTPNVSRNLNVKCLEEQNSQEEKATEKQLSLERWICSQNKWIHHREEQVLDQTEWRIRQRVQELF
jgi:hypothetical protein